MGAVYEAIQEPIERRVAVKILHGRYAQEPEIAQRFFNEARAVNIVDHPGIVQISDYGQLPSGVAYLVMEFLKGDTLGQRLKANGGKLAVPEVVRISRQIAAALAAAHEKGVIHRDLKPAHLPSRNENGTDWGKRREKRVDDPTSMFGCQAVRYSF